MNTPDKMYLIMYGSTSNNISEATELLLDYADSDYFNEIVAIGAWLLDNNEEVLDIVRDRYGNA